MRRPFAATLFGVLASCGGLGAWGDAEVVVHAVDHDAPKPGLTVFALADDSSRLGSAVTDERGVARIKVGQAGSMWLAANAGEGRGFVSRVTVQRLGTTDVGERAMTLLDEQPSVFRLKGLGYEERVTELEGPLIAFAVGHGVVLASESFQTLGEWGFAPRQRLVEVEIETGRTTTLLDDVDRSYAGLTLEALGDGRYLEVVLRATRSTAKWYDSELRRFVHEVEFDGPVPGASRMVDGVITTPLWRDDGEGNAELAVSRFDPRTSQASTKVVWNPRRGWGNGIRPAAVYGHRIVATSGAHPDVVTEVATFDAVTLDRLGGFSTELTDFVRATENGEVIFGVRQSDSHAEVLQFDTLTGDSRLITSFDVPCGPAQLYSLLSNSRLLSVAVDVACDSGSDGVLDTRFETVALIGTDGASTFRVLPLTGLPGTTISPQPLEGAYLSTVTEEPSGKRMAIWSFAAEAWSLVWQSEPGPWATALATTLGTEHFARASVQGALGTQLVALDQVQKAPERRSPCHTWARQPRGYFVASTGSMTYYQMLDPLTGGQQVFRSALCKGVTP